MPYNITQFCTIQRGAFENINCLILPINESDFEKFIKGSNIGIDLNDQSSDLIERTAMANKFKGKSGQILYIPNLQKEKIESILLCGYKIDEKKSDKLYSTFEALGGKISDKIEASKIERISIYTNHIAIKESTEIAIAIASGIIQKSYKFTKYITDQERLETQNKIENIEVICEEKHQKQIDGINNLLESIYLARDLTNEPANILYPECYAEIIKNEMMKYDNVEVKILNKSDIQKLEMGAFLGVNLGSDKEPRIAIVEYKGNKNKETWDIALIGKGLTFDSGGLSIKPANGMESMKGDMAGSAVVFGNVRLLAKNKSKINAIMAVGITENMINGSAQRPGDIVKSMSGQTIEVLNTDAEGRLVLADVLYYVKTKYNPEKMIDVATLTGAIVVALGSIYAGAFCNDDDFSKEIQDASEKSGEKTWKMPLDSEYTELMKSDIADLKNITGGAGGGSCTAACFLEKFIDGHKKWAHLDIAGVDLLSSSTVLSKKGASGFGLKIINQILEKIEEK